jgi:hypothetical protein
MGTAQEECLHKDAKRSPEQLGDQVPVVSFAGTREGGWYTRDFLTQARPWHRPWR